MPALFPLRAIRYAARLGEDISTRIAPPYDVLDEGPKRALLATDPRNIVEIDLPVTPPKTVGPDEAYERAGRTMRQWLADGVLVRDGEPAMFSYEQVFTVTGRTHRRRGLIANLGLEPFGRHGGGIHRHEHTIRAGTDDRYKLMEATGAQLSAVFGVVGDRDGQVREILGGVFDSRQPDFRATTSTDGTGHLVWMIRDRETIEALTRLIEPRDVFIADGHHRYTTALNYRESHPERPEARRVLFVLVPMEDAGLIVQATHRILIGVSGFTIEKVADAVRRDGRLVVTRAAAEWNDAERIASELPGAGTHAFALIDPASKSTHILTTTGPDPLAADLPQRSAAFRNLDVAIAHELFIERILRRVFPSEIAFKYPQIGDVQRLLNEQPGRLAILLQPTPLKAVCDVSLAGDVMPPKSTYFFPKMATGLVINPLSE